MSATAAWGARVTAYLAYRRSFGFELAIGGRQLESFAHFVDQCFAENLTLEFAADWARASKRLNWISRTRHTEVLRSFARFCLRTEAETVIPPNGISSVPGAGGLHHICIPT
jgi:hypothetical protein